MVAGEDGAGVLAAEVSGAATAAGAGGSVTLLEAWFPSSAMAAMIAIEAMASVHEASGTTRRTLVPSGKFAQISLFC
jgi:hypothetical protein